MSEATPLKAARIAVVRDRLGALLAEQPGAFETYATDVQTVTPAQWWDADQKTVGNPVMLAWIARFWPDQPLSRTLAVYYEISDAALAVAQRPVQRVRWAGQSPESKKYLKTLGRRTGRTEDSLQRMSANFDDRKRREAFQLIQVATAKIRAAVVLLAESGNAEFAATKEIVKEPFVDKDAIFRATKNGLALLKHAELFGESLLERSFGGFYLPQSMGQWRMWETIVGRRLLELGVDKSRVVELFKAVSADPEDERTRISRNLRRQSKQTKATAKRATARQRATFATPKPG